VRALGTRWFTWFEVTEEGIVPAVPPDDMKMALSLGAVRGFVHKFTEDMFHKKGGAS
jgi:hypothetical protein